MGTDLSSGILAHQIQSYFHLPYRVRGLLATEEVARPAHASARSPSSARWKTSGEIAAAYRATDVLVVAGTLPGQRLRGLMEACERGV